MPRARVLWNAMTVWCVVVMDAVPSFPGEINLEEKST
jgi:hypothetical protein